MGQLPVQLRRLLVSVAAAVMHADIILSAVCHDVES